MRFNEKVYRVVSKIPKGKISTYKAVASAVRNPKAYRAVGNALNKNPYAPKIACHRIISSDGGLGGFAKGVKAKIRLLKKEGIKIRYNKVDLNRYVYRLK